MKASIIVAASSISTCSSFVPSTQSKPLTSLNGLFDGVKEAFGADGMGSLEGDRETPIDRWMGWNAKSSDEPQQAVGSKAPVDFVDSMDTENYIAITLPKPMGIVFEENDSEYGGIFVLEISEGSVAEAEGTVRPGDQLVSVGGLKVSGMQFEEALGKIIDSTEEKTKLTFFRGPAKFLYGPAGASQEWLDDFIKGANVKVEAEA
mmetsp:Transcript_12348/g.29151  ORF Transcript_12348/g.29151 Transcript_12348/m.29151 type:complete len:205 (+) Transcript_12348:275-889(+)